jgi:hypothetical protein
MVAAVVTVSLYSMNVANALSTNMTMNSGPNMTKTMSTHHKTTEIKRVPGFRNYVCCLIRGLFLLKTVEEVLYSWLQTLP